jgi:hypothetical protein
MTAAGRRATASDRHSQTVSRHFFSLPTFDKITTELHLHAEKFTQTVLHLNLGHFVGFFFFFPPLMRQRQNYFWDTISRTGGWGTNNKIIKTETLLHLNLEIYFILFHFQYSLSNACLAYCWLVSYLSLFISLKLVCFLQVYLFFPFSLPSLLSFSSQPSILNITIAIITS